MSFNQTVTKVCSWAARNGAFTLTFLAMTGTMALAVFKDADVNTLLPTLLGLYVGQKAGTSVSAHWAASKDPKTDTAQVIRDIEGVGSQTPGAGQ